MAMTKLLSIARSNFVRTKQDKLYMKDRTLDESDSSDHGHRRRAEHGNQDNEDDKDTGDSEDDGSIKTSIHALIIQDKKCRRAKSATNFADSRMVHLVDCSPGLVACILHLDTISHGPIPRWEMLVDEVKLYEDLLGSPFRCSLYLSPREHQNMPVRSQGSLITALREVKDGVDVRITTAPPSEDTEMTNADPNPPTPPAQQPAPNNNTDNVGSASNDTPIPPSSPQQPVPPTNSADDVGTDNAIPQETTPPMILLAAPPEDEDNDEDEEAFDPMEEVLDPMNEEDADEDADEMALQAAMVYAARRSDTSSARRVAERVDLIVEWTKAADVWGSIRLADLRNPPDGKRTVPGTTTQVLEKMAGPLGGCLLADEMGLLRSRQNQHDPQRVLELYLNFVAVLKTYAPNVYKKAFPEGTLPSMSEHGTIHDGVAAWPNAWEQQFADSLIMKCLPREWRPKFVILHGDAAKFASQFHGEQGGITGEMRRQDWAQVCVAPDWTRSRLPGDEYDPNEDSSDISWAGESDWIPHRDATTTRPAPSSWIVVDELHSAAARCTLTYIEIIDSFRKVSKPQDWSAVTGITGSPMSNGVTTIAGFTEGALQRSLDDKHLL
ncbi:hypothetical protein J3E71DRAFT_340397 [Bipolaris maydis]|nr:hypothetical protein J3E71DRAFT_340397 [Bipolaris maydis]